MRRAMVVVALVLLAGCSRTPTMLLVGDSNLTMRPHAVADGFDGWDLDVRAIPGASILPGDCATCSPVDWAATIEGADVPTAVVVELGVNDALFEGTPESQGWADYGAKVDWLLTQLPKGAPVYWSNLPCPLERAKRRPGCAKVNAALAAADAAGTLRLVDWAAVARADYFEADHVHLTREGVTAWTRAVLAKIG